MMTSKPYDIAVKKVNLILDNTLASLSKQGKVQLPSRRMLTWTSTSDQDRWVYEPRPMARKSSGARIITLNENLLQRLIVVASTPVSSLQKTFSSTMFSWTFTSCICCRQKDWNS